MNLRITGYDKEVNRSDPEGLHITYDMDSDRPIVSMTFWMDDGATPLECNYPVKSGTDGRYFRGINVKPTINGEHYFHLLVIDDEGNMAEVQSETPVTVTGGPVEGTGDPMEDLSGLYDLVRQTRIDLYPDLYIPGHPESIDRNPDSPNYGFLRIDRIKEGVHDEETGLNRGAEWGKELMRRVKEMWPDYNVGMSTAKRGSANHGGATDEYEQGFVTDAFVLGDNGAHWDYQIDSGRNGLPSCNLVDEYWTDENGQRHSNWEPMKERFVPIEDI
jgi:hypothetical protein